MQSFKHIMIGSGALLVGGLAQDAEAKTIVLDPFTTEQYASTPNASSNSAAAPFAIGNQREFSVTSSSNRASATQLTTQDGYLDFNNAARTTGSGLITWNGENNAGLGGYDLTAGGANDAVFLDVLFADANVGLTFSVTDTIGQTSSFEFLIDEVLEGELAFSYGDFEGAADFTDVATISLGLVGLAPAADITLDVVYFDSVDPGTETPAPVPLPASALLLGPAVLALAAFKRRKSKA